MTFDLTLTLDDTTLAPFRSALDALRDDPNDATSIKLARDAKARHLSLRDAAMTPTLARRLLPIQSIAQMLVDTGWSMTAGSRASLVAALRYFVEPADLIPDNEPTFGLLDDAIVLELALGDARHDWLAWQEFCAFRAEHGAAAAANRESWMRSRELSLQQQIRNARRGTYSGPLSLDGHNGRTVSYLNPEAMTAFRVH